MHVYIYIYTSIYLKNPNVNNPARLLPPHNRVNWFVPTMFSLPPAASSMVKTNKLVDDNDENESVIIDCQLVEFLKDEILSQSTNVPREFIMRVVMLLNRGSVLSTGTAARGTWLFC